MDSNIEGYKFKKRAAKANNVFYSYNRTNKSFNVRLYFLHRVCHNSDTFRSILIIFRELLNVSKAYKNSNMLATKTST